MLQGPAARSKGPAIAMGRLWPAILSDSLRGAGLSLAARTRIARTMMRRSSIARIAVTACLAVTLSLAVVLPTVPAAAAEIKFPPGSRLGLVPSDTMAASTSFPGFEDVKNRAFVRLVEMPLEAYSELEQTLTAEALKKQGMILEHRRPLDLDGNKARC